MVKTNVIKRAYRVTMERYSGAFAAEIVLAESPAAARLKAGKIPGWEIAEVAEL